MTYRAFEAQVFIAGQEQLGVRLKSFEIESSRYESCDSASLVFVVDRSQAGASALWFEQDATSSIPIQIQMRDQASASPLWQTVFDGQVDHIQYSPDAAVLRVECRDVLARLVDLRVQESWLNHTGEELLKAVATAAGLASQIGFPEDNANVMSGQFWQVEHKRLALLSHHRFQTAADVAFTVARDAGCDLYGQDQTLVCTPVLSATDAAAVVHDVRGAVLRRSFGRDMQAERGIVVCMASWDSRQRSATTVYYDGKTYSTDPLGDGVNLHSFRVPGCRLYDLKRLAVGKYARISAHSRSAHMTLPGQIGLQPRQFVQAGDGAWQRVLAVDRVLSRFSVEDGFVQDLVVRSREGG